MDYYTLDNYDIKQYVIKYLKDRYNYDFSEDIKDTPWHKIVGLSFDAHVYYKKEGWYKSLDDVKNPTEGDRVSIRGEGTVDRYEFHHGKWESIGGMTDEMYK